MKTQDAKNFIINNIKKQELFKHLKPVFVSGSEERICIAMTHTRTKGVEYVLEFNIKSGYVIKYDCFDHLTTAYELSIYEHIAHKVKDFIKDAE